MKKQNAYAVIIGGGASGMMCAVRAAENHPDQKIILLEKADRVGKKLLVTGNGRCNLSHIGADSKSYHGNGSEELINILFEKYNTDAVLACFRRLGLLTHTDSEGRVYPLSNQAGSVLDVLRKRMAELQIEEVCDTEVQNLQMTSEGYIINLPNRTIRVKKSVIAAGGRTDYAGRDCSNRVLLRSLGLKTAPCSPSLSPVNIKSDILRSLKGIRVQAQASLVRDHHVVKAVRGEVQFTENALSGICIFDLSREANHGSCEIRLNLLPDDTAEQIYDEISRRAARNPQVAASEIFVGMFHKNIGFALLKSIGVRPSALCKDISDKEIKMLCSHIASWRFICEEKHDFNKAQVTAGGVSLSEIDPHTFECRRYRGMYIIGEALDVDGDCGGYNLQFAFASGLCAGDSL